MQPIPGIPTVYKGRQYRSRLEARWACFFDLLGWPFEYEPFDLPGWIPDFVIHGATEVLVEVKPVTCFPWDVAIEIENCPGAKGRQVLIVGCIVPISDTSGPFNTPSFGWLREGDWGWGLGWSGADFVRIGGHEGPIGFIHSDGLYSDRISGLHYKECGIGEESDDFKDVIVDLWTRAGNLTQWRGKQSITT